MKKIFAFLLLCLCLPISAYAADLYKQDYETITEGTITNSTISGIQFSEITGFNASIASKNGNKCLSLAKTAKGTPWLNINLNDYLPSDREYYLSVKLKTNHTAKGTFNLMWRRVGTAMRARRKQAASACLRTGCAGALHVITITLCLMLRFLRSWIMREN